MPRRGVAWDGYQDLAGDGLERVCVDWMNKRNGLTCLSMTTLTYGQSLIVFKKPRFPISIGRVITNKAANFIASLKNDHALAQGRVLNPSTTQIGPELSCIL